MISIIIFMFLASVLCGLITYLVINKFSKYFLVSVTYYSLMILMLTSLTSCSNESDLSPNAPLKKEQVFIDEFNNNYSSQWIMYNYCGAADILTENGFLKFISRKETVWWKADKGPAMFYPISGDFNFETTLKIRKTSDTTQAPDKEWQFGGIMLRDPNGDANLLENYVFIALGYRGTKIQIEVKSTKNNVSDVDGIDWDYDQADLRIRKVGTDYFLFAKPVGSPDWQQMRIFSRPDLPEDLYAGIMSYSYSYGRNNFDMTAYFYRAEISR